MFYKDASTERFIIGGMSGTSSDGVTFALIRIKGAYIEKKIAFLDYVDIKYPKGLREEIFSLYPGKKFCIENIAKIEHKVMGLYINAIEHLLKKTNIPKKEISLISYQGPILYYAPPLCIELSRPSKIKETFDIPVISHLREQDIAAGGRGAPLSPYVDYLLFHNKTKGRIIQNIGGIANLTAIFPGQSIDEVISFDTGPGNMIIDYLVNEFFEKPYDKDGEIAKSGKVSKKLLDWLMMHPYIKKNPPKTTGREVFGETFGKKVILKAKELGISKEDTIATLTLFTVEAILLNYKKFVFPYGRIDEIILGGGGVYNKTLIKMLKERLPGIEIHTHKDYGIPDEAREALTWAILGDETFCGIPSNLPHITGARKKVLQGSITL